MKITKGVRKLWAEREEWKKFGVTKGADMSDWIQLLAFWFWSGFHLKAPGTVGTIAAIPLHVLMVLALDPIGYGVVTCLLAVAGIGVCDIADKYVQAAGGKADHGSIVFDEVVGFLITMSFFGLIWESASWQDELLRAMIGFGFFRLFDIKKFWTIGRLDRKYHGGFGIMIDDAAAAVPAGILSIATYVVIIYFPLYLEVWKISF